MPITMHSMLRLAALVKIGRGALQLQTSQQGQLKGTGATRAVTGEQIWHPKTWEQPSVSWDTGNRGMSSSLQHYFFTHIPSSFTGRDVSSPCHSCRTEGEHVKESSNISYLSPSAILPMTKIQEGLFSKSTSLFGLWRALMKSRTNRSLFLGAFIFTRRDNSWIWCYLRGCTVSKQAMTITEHRLLVFFFLWLNINSWKVD